MTATPARTTTGPGILWRQANGEHAPLPDRCDDIVIGAGITGLVTALMLARAGRHVIVLEARHPGAGATGRTTGKVSVLQGTKLSRLAEDQSVDVAGEYLRANLAGQDWIRQFCASAGVTYSERPAVTCAGDAQATAAVRREFQICRSLGLPVRWEDSFGLFSPWGATVLDRQLQLDPGDLIAALISAVTEAGGTIASSARVQQVSERVGTLVELEDGRELRSTSVVVATGSPVVDRMLAFTRLTAERSYLTAWRFPRQFKHMVLSVGEDVRSVRGVVDSDGSPLLLVGGAAHVVGRTEEESAHLNRLQRWTRRHFPGATELCSWSAQDHRSNTGLPLVGRMASDSDPVRVATGYDKWGLTNAPAAASALVGDILGTNPLGKAGSWLGQHSQSTTWLRTNFSTARRLVTDLPKAATGKGLCTHLGGVLHWNDVEQSWDCPLHGSRFAADGEVLEGPATKAAKVE